MTTFILKNGETKQVDVTFFDNDRLKDIDNNYYYDSEILSIQNDHRKNMCRCNYCGFIGTKEEMEQHFIDEESKELKCCDCFYKRAKHEKISTTKNDIENGYIQTEITKVTYIQCDNECIKFNHRKHGYTEYNEKNIFFLAYPNGFIMSDEDIQKIIFDFVPKYQTWGEFSYKKKFGSYFLTYENKWGKFLFILENARNKVSFQYDKETENFILYDEIYKDGKLTVSKNLKERYGKENLICNQQVKKFFKERLEG